MTGCSPVARSKRSPPTSTPTPWGCSPTTKPSMVPTLVGLSVRDVAAAMGAWRECATADRDPQPEPPRPCTCHRRWPGGGGSTPTSVPRPGNCWPPPYASPRAPTSTANPPAVSPPAAPTPSPTSADTSWTTNTPAGVAATDPTSTWSSTSTATRPCAPPAPPASTAPASTAPAPTGCYATPPSTASSRHGRSAILDYGTTTRTIPAPLYNALVVRDRHCRFPGCDRPAAWCEGHHIHPWQAGGPTQLANLVLLCSRHHHLLHRPRWHTKLLPDTTLEITDPTGHVRTSHPPTDPPGPPLPLRE